MKILIVGGTGNISWRLTEAALRQGWDVTLLNRGSGSRRPASGSCRIVAADIRDVAATDAALGSTSYDAVVDFLCYNAKQAADAVALFGRRTGHYVFVSTTALYDRALSRLPLTECSPLIASDGWDYALAKAQAEQVFAEARVRDGFAFTTVRPAHTYDVIIPEAVGNADWTNCWRLLNGKPIVVHGDGTTLWTLTHSIDLANGIVALLSSHSARGEAFNVTSDDVHTWRDITAAVCREIGVAEPRICYRTTEEIDRITPRLGNGLKGHKRWCDLYDNAKFKAACPSWRASVPLETGLAQAVAFFREDERRMVPNAQLDAVLDEICAAR